MRIIKTEMIYHTIKEVLMNIAHEYPEDVAYALSSAKKTETKRQAVSVLSMLEENATIAKEKRIPICQDTGMVIVQMTIGQEVLLEGEDINKSIQRAVADAYQKAYLRNSVVCDPLFNRKNTGNNTPAIVYYQMVAGEQCEIEVIAKGFGSENTSRIKMCKPAEGVVGIKEFVVETVQLAGPNACPPMIVGVGIGGSFDYVAFLAKKALLRPLDSYNHLIEYETLEKELLDEINALGIGPMGLHGKTTALKVNIEWFPTHIASLPVAVNINCHVSRHQKVVL